MEYLENVNTEEMIKNLIKDFNEKEPLEDLSQYDLDLVLKETQDILSKYLPLFLSSTSSEKSKKKKAKKLSMDSTELTPDDIPFESLKYPTDFIDFLENQIPKMISKTQKNLFILKKYEQEKKPNFTVCDLNPQEELSQLIFREDKNFFGSLSFEDKIILSDNFGNLKFYSIKDKKLVRTLPNPNKNIKKSKIYSLDINEEGDVAFLGYENGTIAIFDLEKNKCREMINNLHKNKVINIKIIEQTREKQFKILSSDIEGNVYLVDIKKGLLGIGYSSKPTIFCQNNKFPYFIISLLKFKENELKKNSLSKLNKAFIIGNLEKIELYSHSKEPEKIFSFDKPDYLKDYYIPDCAFGLGVQPSTNELSFDDDADLQILLLISWERVIYLHVIPILDNKITYPLLLGYYVNNTPIVRIGFLNLSSIYLIDKEGYFKILDTRRFNQGIIEIQQDLLYPLVPERNSLAELQTVLKFNSIMKQIYLKVKDADKETYLYSILNNNTKDESSVCVLTENKIYYQELVDYQKYLKDLQKKENWMGLLILGINIYKGKMAALNGIPFKKKDRKATIGEYLQDLISQFLFTNAGTQQVLNNSKNNYFDPSQEKARIEKNMEITIEFCIEIDSVNYLLDKIYKIYESKKYKEVFLEKLEPFILCDKMKKFEINEEIIMELIKLYESKKNYDTLGQVLTHLNIKSIDTPKIRQKIDNLFLTSPMIYISVYGGKVDYFKPISFIYDKFIKAEKLDNFINYEDSVKNKKISINKIKLTKQYIGHKLLWYIEQTLNKKKFPSFIENIEDRYYCKATSEITYWILNNEVLQNLLYFDSTSFFSIISFIFGNKDEKKGDNIIETLEENNEDPKKKEAAFKLLKTEENNTYTSENIAPKDLVEYFIERVNNFISKDEKNIINLYLNIFIVTIGKRIHIEKKLKKDAVKFIIQKYYNYDNNKFDIQNVTNSLLEILEDNEFDPNDYKEILNSMTKHSFDDVRLLIYKKSKNYKECLELFLDEKSQLLNKKEDIFQFINMTLYNLSNSNEKNRNEPLDNFKKIILNNLDLIGAKNIENFEIMISTWFADEKKKVLESLKNNQDIQLKYVELLVKKLIKSKNGDEDIDFSEMKEDEQKYIKNFLILHIKLLCIKKESDKVLKYLKLCDLYPIDECLETCQTYEVTDGLVFLYKKLGSIDKALDVCLELIQKLYNSIKENLNSNNFQENKYIVEKGEFVKALEDAINILVENEKTLSPYMNLSLDTSNENSENIDVKEQHKLWSHLLDNIYKLGEGFINDNKDLKENNERYKPKKEFEKMLQDQFQKLLMVMSRYVGIKYILDIVYKTNKNAKFSEFKPLLFEMLKSYESQENILCHINNDLRRECINNINDLSLSNKTGTEFEFDNYSCDICKQSFSDTLGIHGKILHFPCEHMEHDTCSIRRRLCQICLEKEYQENITKAKKGTDYYEDKIHSQFLMLYDEYKRESNIKERKEKKEKKEIKEKKKNVGSTISKKFNRLIGMDNYIKSKKQRLYFEGSACCSNLVSNINDKKDKKGEKK